MGVVPVVRHTKISAPRTIRQTFVRDEVIGYVRRSRHALRTDDSLSVGQVPGAGLMVLMAAKSLAVCGA